MNLLDLFHFLLGDADTIRRLAADPWTLAVGSVLVFSAGLARNYDTHDLRSQWWRLLLPFAASTAAAAVLFLVVAALIRLGVPLAPLGWGILGLFWLTAPFAWLYGLPFERFLRPAHVYPARLAALGVVSSCRVAVMTRCVSVLCGCDWREALLIVLCFAVPTVLLAVTVALGFVRKPETANGDRPGPTPSAPPKTEVLVGAGKLVARGMMGIPDDFDDAPPLPPKGLAPPAAMDQREVAIPIGCLAVLAFALATWLLVVSFRSPKRWQPAEVRSVVAAPSADMWLFAMGAVLWWDYWALRRQPAQRRRTLFARRLQTGDTAKTVRALAALHPENFPPHWDPSTALLTKEYSARLLQAIIAALELPITSWVRARFVPRLALALWLDSDNIWLRQDNRTTDEQLQDLARLVELLRKMPKRVEILQPYQEYLAEMCEYTRERDPPRHEMLEDLLALALRRR